jgi:23S rRNA pseudouridine955/2504/2580 synthase
MNIRNKLYTVTNDESGQRLDKFIASHSKELSFVAVQKLLRTGKIRINGNKSIGSKRIEVGDNIKVPVDRKNTERSNFYIFKELNGDFKSFVNSNLLYKDKDLIAVDKPAGFAVQGGSRITNHIDGVLDYFRFDAPYRPQLLHRLDKATSGVLLISRRPTATRRLTEAFRERVIKKLYWALINGHLPKTRGSINAPLAKQSIKNYERIIFDINGKESKTLYNVLWKGKYHNKKVSLVEFQPETGRKHQIRAHCKYIGCSIIGDDKYVGKLSKNNYGIEGLGKNMFLHAKELALPDKDGLTIRIKSPIPNHMLHAFDLLKLPKNIFN